MANSVSYQPFGSVGTRSGGMDMFSPVRVRLYLGPDHLLQVEKSLAREHYHRMYFRDIEALVWAKTNTWLWNTLVLGLIFLPLAALAIIAMESGAEYFLGPLAGLVFLLMLENLRQGRTCRVYLKTPAQYVELASVKRVKEARRLLDLLRPLIQQHQAPLVPPSTGSSPAPPPSTAA